MLLRIFFAGGRTQPLRPAEPGTVWSAGLSGSRRQSWGVVESVQGRAWAPCWHGEPVKSLHAAAAASIAFAVMTAIPANANTTGQAPAPAITCDGGQAKYTFNPGFTLIAKHQRVTAEILGSGCRPLTVGLPQGFEQDKTLSLKATFTVNGIGQCVPPGVSGLDTPSPVAVTWSNGAQSTLSLDPFGLDLARHWGLTGQVTDGALTGYRWDLTTGLDTKALQDGIQNCWNVGIKNFTYPVTQLRFSPAS